MNLCPLCHHAEPLAKTEYGAASSSLDLSVKVKPPRPICGRCGVTLANDALLRVEKQWAQMKDRG